MKTSKKELFYNKLAEEWESKINKREMEKRLKVIFGGLLKGVELRGRLFLEVGCGLGYFSKKAAVLGAKVTGVDVGKKLVEISKVRVPTGKFLVASASKLPFKDKTFDIVLCTEVIEHVEEQKKALKEIFRVSKKGGLLVITSPNRIFRPLFLFLSLVGIRPYHGNERWLYTWQLQGLLAMYGRIKKEAYFNFIYPSAFFDYFERFKILKNLMINQGYLVEKP